ncbi:MAG: hypothetical protein RLZZ301_1770 [Bacteroidota bacterium]|jgi:hypothetical protein
MKKSLFIVAFIGFQLLVQAQQFPFELALKKDSIAGFTGLHSFVYGQRFGKIVAIGGRTDGIHARQPFNAFPAAQNNQQIVVLDLLTKQVWTANLSSLSGSLQEQLQSSNANFCQDGNALVVIGGYAYSQSAADHITFPYLTRIDLDGLIDAVMAQTAITPFFEQISDPSFAVCGGNLVKINAEFLLIGGHRFDGRYNPMGGNTYVQTYTNAIRRFELTPTGTALSLVNSSETIDQLNVHRRDYNLVPHVFPTHELGYLISSGVFQPNADLPFLYPVELHSDQHTPVSGFSQYLSNYHSSHVSLYDAQEQQMHHLFLGGLSQYYYENGQLQSDPNVPFVRTISRLTQDADSSYHEFLMNTEVPVYLGTSSAFILKEQTPLWASEIIDMNAISADSILIGHILGGIYSSQRNPFTQNQTNFTSVNPYIYEVWLKRSATAQIEVSPTASSKPMVVYPNPSQSTCTIEFQLPSKSNVELFVLDAQGKLVHEVYYEHVKNGKKTLEWQELGIKSGAYTLQFIVNDQEAYPFKIQIE